MTSSLVDAQMSLGLEAANSQGLISVQGPGKAKKEDKDKIKLTDLIDKTKATKDERDADVDEVDADLLLDESGNPILKDNEADIYAELAVRHEDTGADNDQIFLIDGDSLLHEILLDPLLDLSHGGQFLHVIYALEQYIKRFQEGGRIFRFVFFHCAGSVAWHGNAFISLVRDRVIAHLRELHMQVNEFTNWWEAGFIQFLERVDPAFVLVGDGAGVDLSASSSSSAPATADSVAALTSYMSGLSVSSSAAAGSLQPAEITRSLTLFLLSYHFRVIRLTELSFAGNAMYGFQMAMASAYKKKLREAGGYKPDEKLAAIKGDVPTYTVESQKQFDAKVYAAAAAVQPADRRLAATLYAIVRSLQLAGGNATKADASGLSPADFARAALIHTVLLQSLPVDARALVWEAAEEKSRAPLVKYAALLASFQQQLLVAWCGSKSSEVPASGVDLAPTLDLFDGRLLSFVLYALRDKKITSLGWSASLEKQLQASWDVVKKEAKAADFLPLFSLKSIAASGVTDLDESQLAKDAREKASKERTSVVAGAKVGGAKAAATSGAAGTAAPAKAEDEDLGNWDDEDAEVTPAPKKAAPAPAPKKEEEEELGSWEDMSDEEEEKVEEKKAAPVAAAAAAAPAVATSSSAESVVPPEAKELQPIVTLENKFVKDISGALDARLQAHGLLLADSAYAKPLTPYAVKYAITPEKPQLDDGMDSEVKVAAPTTKKEQRSVSRMVNYWEQYSKSLVGGRLVLREVVIASVKEEADEDDDEEEEKKSDKKGGKKDKADKPKKAGKPGAGGGKKGTKSAVAGEKLSIKDKIRQQVEDAQKAKDAKKIQGKINIASSMSTLPNKIAKLDSELEQVGDASAIPALLQLLEWEMALWKESKPKNEIEPAIKLFVLIHDIYRRFRQFLSADEFKKVMTALIQIGYEDFAHRMAKEFAQLSEGKFTYEQVKVDVKSSSFPATLIGMNYNRFQLEYCGPYMLRNVDSAPDPRVTSFYPDLWQRKLLDVADANESALLVAPTSAGKSFISYYVLKNVLAANKVTERTSEKGVVVYVAPNKALVNQVSADIYQRYGLVFGTATDDHQDKALTSEVLITVPSVLERLLLSPHRESWIKKIRWVIFDEVHLISSAGEGSIWERCLALIRCPFLALSATVGNPSEFHGWLSRLDALRNRKVHVIVHQTRWSDLEKAMYVPADPSIAPHVAFADNNFKFDMRNFSLLPSQWTGVRVHPAAAVGDNFGDNLEFPSEISFTPRDSLSLYDALAKFSQSLPENLKKEFAALSPEVFFPEMLIPKARAMEYESTLKKVLAQWLKAGLTKEVNQVMAALTGDLKDRLAKMEGNAKVGQNCYDNAFIRRHFFSLLLELHARDQLPGIVFSNDSELCVQLVTDTLEKLEELESKTLEQESNTADSKAKIKQKAAMLKALKKKRDATMKNKTAEEEARYADELDIEIEADKDEYIVDPRFSFIDQTEKMDAKELDYWVKRTLYKTQWKKTHPLIRALYRGIGVHHGGLVKQYRDLVETLFRGKHLKVVVSTASLALGINMPARSVTLCGDSKLLTPLQYRQMSGRAGRRGYDNVGHVMFFAIPPRKVYRLLKSPLNSLRGHYPVNSTLTLRMSDYYTIVNDKKEATGALTPLLREPFFQTTWSGQNLLAQINYHFRFNLDYLFQKSLINVKGAAYGLSTLATHMHAADPSNFGFTALLESGHLSKICQRFDIDKNGVAKELLTLLAHLFYRVPVPSHLTRANFRADSHNLILLPPLDPEVKKIISQHNATTMSQFTNYLKSFAQLELGKVPVDPAADAAAIAAAAKTESSASKVYEGFYQLPVSGVNFPWVWSKTNAADDASTLSGALSSARLSIEARSPFVATSGHDDSFDSSRNLAESVRNGIFLDSKLIPVCMDDRDARGKELQLNAYVVDFYWKQHFYSLVTDNRLSDAFAWGLLKNWSLLLNNITVALKTLSSDAANDLVVKSFDHLSTTFESYFSGIINI